MHSSSGEAKAKQRISPATWQPLASAPGHCITWQAVSVQSICVRRYCVQRQPWKKKGGGGKAGRQPIHPSSTARVVKHTGQKPIQ